MPINSKHPAYTASATKWKRARHAIEGQDSIHSAGEAYLPKLGGQTPEEYASYKLRANYFNATGRSHEALLGLAMRKDPVHDFPTTAQSIVDDACNAGVSAASLAKYCVSELLAVGRVGLLVEYPEVSEAPSNAAAAAAAGLRPYISAYATESIINWKEARINNTLQPVLVVLEESYEHAVDEWTAEARIQYRELVLLDGVYTQRVWREEAGKGFVCVSTSVPMMHGKPIPSIPFFVGGAIGNDLVPDTPPMLDLINVNLAHYRVSADYEHACHFASLPTPVVTGHTLMDGQDALRIGSATAWLLPDPQADAKYLEFTGQGLGAVEKNLASKEAHMASLGARLLAGDKGSNESGSALQIKHNGEYASLSSISNSVSELITRAIRFACAWAGISGADLAVYKLSVDFFPNTMTAQELTALVSAWQQGAISKRTLFANLQRREVIGTDLSFEDEEQYQEEEGPTGLPALPAPAANDNSFKDAA